MREESICQCRTGLTGGNLEGPYLPKSLLRDRTGDFTQAHFGAVGGNGKLLLLY